VLTMPACSPLPLHSYMKTLLQSRAGIVQSTPEIVCDNAASPTRSLRMQQRQLIRTSRIRPSFSERPSSLYQDEKRIQWQRLEATSYSFQSPPTSKSSWNLKEESPCSVAFLSALSPKSARWSPKPASLPAIHYYLSPKSARWCTMHPCLLRQDSDPVLICPSRRASDVSLMVSPDCPA
jgi:hypothetical protein